jgi:hypothetical protein
VDSVKVVTNDAGMVVTSHEYLLFGEDRITECDTKNARESFWSNLGIDKILVVTPDNSSS